MEASKTKDGHHPGRLPAVRSMADPAQRDGGGFLSEGRRMTLEVIQKLEKEVKALEFELHNELPKEIQRARELGDLSENAEYAAAKERQDLVGARIAQLKQRLSGLRMVDLTKIPRDSVGLGSTVLVFDVGKNVEVEYNLVTSEEADVPNGKISTTSPIGRSLLGKKAGDVAEVRTPGGPKEFEILKLTTIYGDAAGNDQE
jgi:transcription elongation factor GreA